MERGARHALRCKRTGGVFDRGAAYTEAAAAQQPPRPAMPSRLPASRLHLSAYPRRLPTQGPDQAGVPPAGRRGPATRQHPPAARVARTHALPTPTHHSRPSQLLFPTAPATSPHACGYTTTHGAAQRPSCRLPRSASTDLTPQNNRDVRPRHLSPLQLRRYDITTLRQRDERRERSNGGYPGYVEPGLFGLGASAGHAPVPVTPPPAPGGGQGAFVIAGRRMQG